MRPLAVVGIILIVLGAIALAYQGITYTSKEKVVDLGPLKVEAKREKTIQLPPGLGGAAIYEKQSLAWGGSRQAFQAARGTASAEGMRAAGELARPCRIRIRSRSAARTSQAAV